MNVSVVRPLVDRLYELDDVSMSTLPAFSTVSFIYSFKCYHPFSLTLSFIHGISGWLKVIVIWVRAHNVKWLHVDAFALMHYRNRVLGPTWTTLFPSLKSISCLIHRSENNNSSVYCLLVNRAQFMREQLAQPHQQSVRTTRALLCELVANRILRRFHEDNPGSQGLLLLAQILVGGFDPFQGAPEEVIREQRNMPWTSKSRTGNKRKLPALEIAIITESKTFLSSSACQRVVNAIYEGRVVYTPTSFIDILPDHYKQKPISLYNPRKAPMFNQYRLIVPRTRNILEICHFLILISLFVSVMANRDASTFGIIELVFIIYTCGWVLDQIGSILEHGQSTSDRCQTQ